MEANLTNWGDFLVFGVFLFFMGIGCTFSRCYREYSKECELTCRNNIMESFFVRSSVGSMAILCFAGLVVLLEALRTGIRFSLEKNKWNVWLAWVPFMIYAMCRIAEDRWSKVWRSISRVCLAGTFVFQFMALYGHIHQFPDGTNSAMYEPQCLMVLATACVILGEGVLPLSWKDRMQWFRCGCTMVQGTWFIQIGSTLCVSGREWDEEDNVSLTVAVVFLWHCALSALIVHFVRKTVKSALCSDSYIEGDFESTDDGYDIISVYGEEDELDSKHPLDNIFLQN